MKGQIAGLISAVCFLTSLPLPNTGLLGGLDLTRALPYFPLVGLGIGGILVGLDALLGLLVQRPLLDFLLVSALVLLSGGLHLDGLVDSADGLLSGGTPEHRLALMRESWAGQRGAIAALGQLMIQFAALSALHGPARVAALLLAPVLGRWAIVVAYVAFPYARKTAGLSLALKQGATPAALAAATGSMLGVSIITSWQASPILLGSTVILILAMGMLTAHRLGGMSGDTYGALEQIVESTTLLLMPTALQLGGV